MEENPEVAKELIKKIEMRFFFISDSALKFSLGHLKFISDSALINLDSIRSI